MTTVSRVSRPGFQSNLSDRRNSFTFGQNPRFRDSVFGLTVAIALWLYCRREVLRADLLERVRRPCIFRGGRSSFLCTTARKLNIRSIANQIKYKEKYIEMTRNASCAMVEKVRISIRIIINLTVSISVMTKFLFKCYFIQFSD